MVMPELSFEDWNGDGQKDLVVNYLSDEGVYFDGKAKSPGLVYEISRL